MDIERAERTPQPIVGVHEVVAMNDLSAFFDRALATAAAGLVAQDTEADTARWQTRIVFPVA